MDGERRAAPPEVFERLMLRHRRSLHRRARRDDRLGDLGKCQLLAQFRSRRRKCGHARHDLEIDVERAQTTDLLGHGPVDRRVTGMDARDIMPLGVRGFDLGDDLIEMHRRGVDHARIGGRRVHDLLRHQRSGIEADRTALDQLQSAHGDEVRRARPGSDEIDGHVFAPFTMPVPAFPL